MITDIKQWLNQPPEENEIQPTPDGKGFHLPIDVLRNLLDEVNWSTRNFRFQIYKGEGYNVGLSVAATIELEISYRDSDGEMQVRTFAGACNFALSSILPISDWCASAKSLCIKNAAIDAAKRFGRELNVGLEKPEFSPLPDTIKRGKSMPDIKIMKQFEEAIKNGDQAAITMLQNVYEIKSDKDYAS